jgi:amino acid efflux transporter
VPRAEVDSVTGLLQLAGEIHPHRAVAAAVTVIAFTAVVLNAVSWVWGVSGLVARAAQKSIFPKALANTDSQGVPNRVLAVLALLFLVVLTVLMVFPGIVVAALAAASAIFLLMYLMCIVSYLRARGLTARSGLNAALLVVMIVSLVQSGWRTLYGLIVLAGALLVQWYRRRGAS